MHFYFTPALFTHTQLPLMCRLVQGFREGEEMKENYTGLSGSHYTSTFYFLFFFYPLRFSLSLLILPFFFYLERRKKKYKKIIDNCRADIYNGRHTQHLEGRYIDSTSLPSSRARGLRVLLCVHTSLLYRPRSPTLPIQISLV